MNSNINNIIVNPETCIGCALCVSLCDTLFKMNEHGISEVISNNITEDLLEVLDETIDYCPVNAISIEKI